MTVPRSTPAKPRPRERILASCKALIADGSLPRGGIMPSEHQLAERLGAKRATVHLALKQLEAEGVVQALGNGQRVVAGGRQATVDSCLADTVAVLTDLPHLSGSGDYPEGYDVHVQIGLVDALRRSGHNVLMLHPDGLLDGRRLDRLLAMPPLGLITTPCKGSVEDSLALLSRFQALGVPVVTDEEGPRFATFDRVVSDHAAGADMLTRLLVQRGHRRILRCWLISGQPGDPRPEWLAERDLGHERALAAAGLAALPAVETVQPQTNYVGDRPAFEAEVGKTIACLGGRLAGPERIDALMLASDGCLPQVAEACRRLGREPGEDLELVGYDNYWRSLAQRRFAADVPLATIDKDNAGIGAAMVGLLDDRLAGRLPTAPQRRLMLPKLLRIHPPSTV